MKELVMGLVCLGACGPSATQTSDASLTDASPRCSAGMTRCTENGLEICGEFGGWSQEQDVNGICTASCSTAEDSYIGCIYFPTQSVNQSIDSICDEGTPLEDCFSFGVSLSNGSGVMATVEITGGDLAEPRIVTVPPGGVSIQRLPWIERLPLSSESSASLQAPLAQDGDRIVIDGRSQYFENGSFIVTSDVPITVYQFNPVDYKVGSGDNEKFSYSNDASLLFPVNALSSRYIVSSYRGGVYEDNTLFYFSYPSSLTVTGTLDETTVTITPTQRIVAGAYPEMQPGVPTSFTIDRGDVVQLGSSDGDITGTVVESDKPVQVISGHGCASMPKTDDGSPCCCDHLEESVLPFQALGGDYIIAAPLVHNHTSSADEARERVIRIIAADGPVELTFDPPIPGAPTSIAATGEFIEIGPILGNHRVQANAKILISEYMVGQYYDNEFDERRLTGDPAMTTAVPVDQYRSSYGFHAPPSYDYNYVTITAPENTAITLDGAEVTGFEPIADTGFAVAHVRLSDDNGGNHNIEGNGKFGITVYGYGLFTSYWYPGGLDLKEIEVVVE